jgi:hypothetical protein
MKSDSQLAMSYRLRVKQLPIIGVISTTNYDMKPVVWKKRFRILFFNISKLLYLYSISRS